MQIHLIYFMIFYKYQNSAWIFLLRLLTFFQIFLFHIIQEYGLKHFLLSYQEQF